jgi:hypothetical protein
MSPADRSRAYRQRLKHGAMAARVDVGEEVFTAMQYRGWTKGDREIPDAEMRRYLARALSEWARSTCPFV